MNITDLVRDHARSFVAASIAIIGAGAGLLIAINSDSALSGSLQILLNVFVYVTFAVAIFGAAWLLRWNRERESIAGLEIESRRLRSQLDEVITNSQTALFAVSREGIVMEVKGAAIAPPGVDVNELVGRRITDIYDDQPRFQKQMEEACAAEKLTSATLRVRHRAFEVTCRPRRLPMGGFDGFTAVAREVTATRAAEEEVRRTNAVLDRTREELRLFRDEAAIAAAVFDRDGRIVHVNRAFAELLGYHEDDLIGKTSDDLTHPDDIGRSMQLTVELRSGSRQRAKIDKRYLCRDGSVVEASTTLAAWRGRDGAVDRVLAQVEDLTEKNANRRCLEIAQRALAMMLDASEEDLLVCGADDRVVSMSQGFADLIGANSEDVVGVHVDELERRLGPLATVEGQVTDWFRGEFPAPVELVFDRPTRRSVMAKSQTVGGGRLLSFRST